MPTSRRVRESLNVWPQILLHRRPKRRSVREPFPRRAIPTLLRDDSTKDNSLNSNLRPVNGLPQRPH